jgi:hypothetical protein
MKSLLVLLLLTAPLTALADACVSVEATEIVSSCQVCMKITIDEYNPAGDRIASGTAFAGNLRAISVQPGQRISLPPGVRTVIRSIGTCQ